MTPLVEHNLDCIHVSKVTKVQLRVLNVQVVFCKVGLIKMWKVCVKTSMTIDSSQLNMFSPF
jgi:hypothetical protein